jgi:glycosyltransferase involved in cell wall biosynthesis
MPVLAPCQTVVTFHDMTFILQPQLHTRLKRLMFPAIVRVSARRAAALLADSESTRQDAIRLLRLTPERITTAPLGVTPEFAPIHDRAYLAGIQEKYHLPERMLLYVGLMEPRKNLPVLLKAFARIAKKFNEYQLVLVGRRGWMVEEIFRQIEVLGIKDRVCFPGYVERADLPAVYNLADVFCYPSMYEGFGLPVLEAMACGTPVVTSRISSLPEIVGEAGEMVTPDDFTALADVLDHLLADPVYRKKLAKSGQAQAAPFTWERTARLTWEVYQRVLAGRCSYQERYHHDGLAGEGK